MAGAQRVAPMAMPSAELGAIDAELGKVLEGLAEELRNISNSVFRIGGPWNSTKDQSGKSAGESPDCFATTLRARLALAGHLLADARDISGRLQGLV